MLCWQSLKASKISGTQSGQALRFSTARDEFCVSIHMFQISLWIQVAEVWRVWYIQVRWS